MTDPTSSLPGLQSLIEHWRAVTFQSSSGYYAQGREEQAQVCANELEAALAVDPMKDDSRSRCGSAALGRQDLRDGTTTSDASTLNGWQPIATAPKDGTFVIVALLDLGQIRRVSDAHFDLSGWYTKAGGKGCHWATHWMPLPDPPSPATARPTGDVPSLRAVELGCAGHLCVARHCQWRRHTQVGNYRISTVGNYFPERTDTRETIGSGPRDFFETAVFRTTNRPEPESDGCGCMEVLDYQGLDGKRYATAGEAQIGHECFVLKYSPATARPTDGNSEER